MIGARGEANNMKEFTQLILMHTIYASLWTVQLKIAKAFPFVRKEKLYILLLIGK